MSWIPALIGAVGSIIGGGASGAEKKASKASAAATEAQTGISLDQWELLRPLMEAFVNSQLSNQAMAQPYMAPMLQYALSRLGGSGLMSQVAVPGITATPGMGQVDPAADAAGSRPWTVQAVDEALGTHPGGGFATSFPGTPGRATPAAGTHPGGGFATPVPGTTGADPGQRGVARYGQHIPRPTPPGTSLWYQINDPNRTGQPLPGPSLVGVGAQPNLADPNPATAQTGDPLSKQYTGPGGTPAQPATPGAAPAAPAAAPMASMGAFPAGRGPFDYDLERAAWERARTDIERSGAQGMAGLQSALGSRFGGSASAGSLAAGAGAELQSKMNEANIRARLGIAQDQQGVEDQRFQQVAQLIGALSGIDMGPVTAGAGQAIQGLGSASNASLQLSQLIGDQKNSWMNALGQAMSVYGAGGFSPMPGIGTRAPAAAPQTYYNPDYGRATGIPSPLFR